MAVVVDVIAVRVLETRHDNIWHDNIWYDRADMTRYDRTVEDAIRSYESVRRKQWWSSPSSTDSASAQQLFDITTHSSRSDEVRGRDRLVKSLEEGEEDAADTYINMIKNKNKTQKKDRQRQVSQRVKHKRRKPKGGTEIR